MEMRQCRCVDGKEREGAAAEQEAERTGKERKREERNGKERKGALRV